jgi:hypothetical protein
MARFGLIDLVVSNRSRFASEATKLPGRRPASVTETPHATHEAALKAAPLTEISITQQAREILRAMERGARGRLP